MNSAKDFTNTAQPKGTLMGVIEDAVRRNKAEQRKQQLEIQRRNDRRKLEDARLKAQQEREEALAETERIKKERDLVKDMLAPLSKLVLEGLALQNYPRAELATCFVKTQRYFFGWFGPRISVYDRAEYAYWEIRPADRSFGHRQILLRSDAVCFVNVPRKDLKRKQSVFTLVFTTPDLYKALRRFATSIANVDVRQIEKLERKFSLDKALRAELGLIDQPPTKQPTRSTWGH